MEPRAVASIVDGTINFKKCIIYDEQYVNSEIKIPVTAEEFKDRPDNWNNWSIKANPQNEAIPTVWLNSTDRTLDSEDIIDSREYKYGQILLPYRSKIPCPLPVITVVLSLFLEAIYVERHTFPKVRIHHAGSLGWPNNRDEVPRELQFIRQYYSSFRYFQLQHRKRLWMTHIPDSDSNEIISVERNPNRSDEGTDIPTYSS